MGDVLAFPGGTFLELAPPPRQEEYAARLRGAFEGSGTTSDALIILAEMAEEASWHAEPEHRFAWHSLARLLSAAAPAFADVPLDGGHTLPPPQVLAAAARTLRAWGASEVAPAADLLERLAAVRVQRA